MGIYLNPGNENFAEEVNSKIYVDKTKKYFDSLAHYSGNLLFVGINYDEKKKTHTCQIERFVKK